MTGLLLDYDVTLFHCQVDQMARFTADHKRRTEQEFSLYRNLATLVFTHLLSLSHARKSSFSKDSACRQAAVSSLVALLRVRVRVSSALGTRLSRGVEKGRGQAGPGLSVDEVIALLKRCLTHQAAVRSLVYRQLYSLQRDHPVYRNVILRLLNSHLLSLLTDEEEETSTYPFILFGFYFSNQLMIGYLISFIFRNI